MTILDLAFEAEDLHPIDLVETLAEHREWDFDRIAEDQIAMAIEGQWRTYSVTLAWSGYDETLRLVCTFDLDPPEDRQPALFELLNSVNDMCWTGAFTYWAKERLMVYRYGLVLNGGASVGPDQVDRLVHSAVRACERFYPAYQLSSWGGTEPAEALNVAIAEAYGRA